MKKLIHFIKTYNKILKTQFHYHSIIKKIRNKKTPIKVIFIVNENQKWNSDSLYRALEKNINFDPIIVITKLPNNTVDVFNKNINFFKDRCYNFKIAFNVDSNTPIPLKLFSPDIVFFQQPYGPLENQTINSISSIALTCYIPYGLMVANNDENHYRLMFQQLLWKYFAPNHIIKKLYLDNNFLSRPSKVVVSGHPKMDIYDTNISKNNIFWPAKIKPNTKIIYAPHHSVDDNSPLKYATFLWNGIELLEYAKKHQHIEWVFKPHPRLKIALVLNKIMTEEEVNTYYQEWNILENSSVYDSGDYFDLFRTSDALITDCGSFLAEYLPTEKPIFLLVNSESKGYNLFGNTLVDTFYKAYDFSGLINSINEVLLNENDFLKNDRLKIISTIRMEHGNAGQFIVNYLENTLIKNFRRK